MRNFSKSLLFLDLEIFRGKKCSDDIFSILPKFAKKMHLLHRTNLTLVKPKFLLYFFSRFWPIWADFGRFWVERADFCQFLLYLKNLNFFCSDAFMHHSPTPPPPPRTHAPRENKLFFGGGGKSISHQKVKHAKFL